MAPAKTVYQLKITLKDSKPPIWRTIQIRSTATFWELHCAIQDAFSWNNSHLHSFNFTDKKSGTVLCFGIPDDDGFDDPFETLPGWKHKITKYLNPDFPKIEYLYDFGDDWAHTIKLEEVLPAETGVNYPRCIKGKRNSPPDDCGGIWAYSDMLEVLENPQDADYEQTKEWIESMKDGPFDPAQFDPESVVFQDPDEIFKRCFGRNLKPV